MKKLFIFMLLLCTNPAWSGCDIYQNSKCFDLINEMYKSRHAISNVLNLTDDQKKCKETIDNKFQKESTEKFSRYEQEKYVLKNMYKHGASEKALNKQEKVVIKIEEELVKMNSDYDKEFKSFLNGSQKGKLNDIRRIETKALKECKRNKALFKQDKNLKPFGVR